MRYAIVIEKAAANYSAYVPDLPGCVATGSTLEETEVQIREAIAFHLDGLRKDGICGHRRLTIRADVPTHAAQFECWVA
jgi:predicted RNase H-like HicB family nuclease